MTEEIKKEEDIFDAANIPASGWFKFDKVGARCSGEVTRVWEQESRDGMPAQRCFSLLQADDSIVNVGLKMTSDYLMGKTSQVKIGDILGVEFKAEVPSVKFKGKFAKSLEVYIKKGVPKKVDDGFGNFS